MSLRLRLMDPVYLPNAKAIKKKLRATKRFPVATKNFGLVT